MKGHSFLHFKTITKHRHIVMRYCFMAGIPGRGLLHDLSKYSSVEFREGAAHYKDSKRSPTESEREDYGFSNAWMHHKGRNRHHFEYWTDYNTETKQIAPVRMPTKYVIEMFCDRVGACRVYKGGEYYDGSAYDYYMSKKARYNMHPVTAKTLERLLFILKVSGEKTVFKYIKRNLVNIRTVEINSKNISRAAKLVSILAKENCFCKAFPASQALKKERAEEYLASALKTGTQAFMALYKGCPAGCVFLKENNIFDLAVLEKRRKKGIGEALLICAVENCSETPTAVVPADKGGAYALRYLYDRGFEDVEADKAAAGTRKLALTERLAERSAKRGI